MTQNIFTDTWVRLVKMDQGKRVSATQSGRQERARTLLTVLEKCSLQDSLLNFLLYGLELDYDLLLLDHSDAKGLGITCQDVNALQKCVFFMEREIDIMIFVKA